MVKVLLKDVRAAFPAFHEPQSVGNSEPAYGGPFIIPPDHPAVPLLDAAMEKAATDKWKAKGEQILKKLIKDGEVCFIKADYLNSDGDPYDGFAGNYYVRTRSMVKPLILDRDKTPLTKMDGKPYAGCYVDAIVDVWAQDNQYGKGIRANLKGVQFRRDGDAFAGGAPASADEFEDLSEGIEDDDDFG